MRAIGWLRWFLIVANAAYLVWSSYSLIFLTTTPPYEIAVVLAYFCLSLIYAVFSRPQERRLADR